MGTSSLLDILGMGETADPCGTGYESQETFDGVGVELNAINIVTRTSFQDAFHDHGNLWLLISYEPVSGNVLA